MERPSTTPSTIRRLTKASASHSIFQSATSLRSQFRLARLMEYRQAELRLEQLYTQIRMQVVNAQFALTNDRAQVQASWLRRDYAQAEPRFGREEVATGRIDDRKCPSAAAQPGSCREQLDRGKRVLCQGSRQASTRRWLRPWNTTGSIWAMQQRVT